MRRERGFKIKMKFALAGFRFNKFLLPYIMGFVQDMDAMFNTLYERLKIPSFSLLFVILVSIIISLFKFSNTSRKQKKKLETW